jgi:phosphoribosyl 1,2-cyclic phosphodiesterase
MGINRLILVGSPVDAVAGRVERMALRFTVLASGSGGNASLIRSGRHGLLLDIGLGPRLLAKRLAAVGSSWAHIHAALLTHTHSDHWNDRTLAYLRRLRIPLFCHPKHHGELEKYGEAFASMRADRLVRDYDAAADVEPIAGVRCRPVALRHDGAGTFGFRLETTLGLFGQSVAIAYATDLGTWSAALADALADVDLLALEFNHDVPMQYASGRSPYLIQRILGERGHLSNEQAAAFVAEVIRRAPGRLQHVVQLHLSQDCNRPRLAKEAAWAAVGQGNGVTVHTAQQHRPLRTIVVGPAGKQVPRPRSAVARSTLVPAWLPGFEP